MYKVKSVINIKKNVSTTLERHPVPVLGIDYKVKIVYKNIKVPELNVENKLIKISLPNKYNLPNTHTVNTYINSDVFIDTNTNIQIQITK